MKHRIAQATLVFAVLVSSFATGSVKADVDCPKKPPCLVGGYVIYWGDKPQGCQIICLGKGVLKLVNELGAEATASPIPGNAFKYTVSGWGPDCSHFTVIVSKARIELLFQNGTSWVAPR